MELAAINKDKEVAIIAIEADLGQRLCGGID
ncbi:hypothetical protein PTD2_10333 [Pseudoalteromonas tunicata D2]|uniref:Uncharacterized protein n=1 Tax=Pseudoalteromonas tunicata D2 TaxID=87626 RepID=A4CEF9_9GAMM|nr:hypothetical protein PTD2_10333 [Pseudoalteromonas tunicata D2]